ncbi:MAG: O-antigen ligase domain-containing protein [Tannerellaceae bacterium]|jgi:hypothetical protein|nr:O-antigen ligase domain-containing protein [Tannerellaceae bacterium]
MIQTYISKYFYIVFLFTLTFGVLLYNIILAVLGFAYTDEICALLIFVLFAIFLFTKKDWEMNKAFLTTLAVFAFYVFYSLYIHSNSAGGIMSDLFIQIKPYLAFFCAYSMMPSLDRNQRSILRSVSFIYWGVLLVIGLSSLFYPDMIKLTMSHDSYYASAVILTSLCYFYCSRFTSLDKLVFLIMLSIGILSGRSKFYGFYAMAVFIVIFFSNAKMFRWNVRNVLVIVCMLVVITLVAWEKIYLYFYQAVAGDVEKDMVARYVLYATSPEIFRDYFPFGSGLASYATYASGLYYSDIYVKYGIDGVWGISRSYYSFVADTYYPSLAQFGVAGVVMYILFWLYILRRALHFYIKTRNLHCLIIVSLIIGFLAIEGIANPTFIANDGVFSMMLLGLVLAGMKQELYAFNDKQSFADESIADQ